MDSTFSGSRKLWVLDILRILLGLNRNQEIGLFLAKLVIQP
jgi:hypothetical protein